MCRRKYFTTGKCQAQNVSESGEPDVTNAQYCVQDSAPGKCGLTTLSVSFVVLTVTVGSAGNDHPMIRSRLIQPGPCSSLETGCPLMLYPSDSYSPGVENPCQAAFWVSCRYGKGTRAGETPSPRASFRSLNGPVHNELETSVVLPHLSWIINALRVTHCVHGCSTSLKRGKLESGV